MHRCCGLRLKYGWLLGSKGSREKKSGKSMNEKCEQCGKVEMMIIPMVLETPHGRHTKKLCFNCYNEALKKMMTSGVDIGIKIEKKGTNEQ